MSMREQVTAVGTGRLLAGGVGIALIGVGGLQLLLDAQRTQPLAVALWVAGLIVVDDLILIPLVLLAGWFASTRSSRGIQTTVQASFIIFGGLLIIGLPFAISPDRNGQNDTLLTQPYGRNLLLLAGIISLTAACIATARLIRRSTVSHD